MVRRKIRLAYVANEYQRKAFYKKRNKGMLKKLDELTVLYNIEAAVIMYSSFEQELVIWLSIKEMEHNIAMFRSLINVEQTRKMVNLEGFIQERIQKVSNQFLKLKKYNKEKEMNAMMYQILEGEQTIDPSRFTNLNDLGWVTDIHLVKIDSMVKEIMKDSLTSVSTLALVSPPTTPTLAHFLSDAFSAIASTSVLGQSFPQKLTSLSFMISNFVAPVDIFSQQNYQGNVDMKTPIAPEDTVYSRLLKGCNISYPI